MFSKSIIKCIGICATAVSLVTLSGCGLKVGEESQTKETAVVQSTACLDQTIDDLKLFVAGDATDNQVSTAVDCLQNVFNSFKENIRGENKDAYTSAEIAIFIEKNFIKDSTTFSASFQKQFMNLKVALVGGNDQLILKTEIDSIIEIIKDIKPDIVRLNKSMKIVVLKWDRAQQPLDESEKEKRFLTAKKDLQLLIGKIAAAFAKTGKAYQVDHLLNFAKELLLFSKSNNSALTAIEKARPFLKKFKVVLIGGDFTLAKSEWLRLGSTLHEGLFQILRYNYFLKDIGNVDADVKWDVYEKIAVDLSGLVEELLDAKESQTLTNFELYEISQSLDKVYPELMLSLPLIESIGRLKVMLLGDSPSGRIGWSKGDFTKLRIRIPVLFEQISVLVKTYKYLQTNQAKSGVALTTPPTEFETIERQTLEAVEVLSRMVEQPYNIYYLKILIHELSKGIFKDVLVLPENFESLFTVALSAKTVLTGEQDNNLSAKNISLLLQVGARFYLHYIEYDIFSSPHSREQSDLYVHFSRLFEKAITTFGLNLKLKQSKMFTTDELTQFMLVLQTEKILTSKIQKQNLDSLFAGLWQNLLNKPEDRIATGSLPGFNATALQQLRQEVNIFLKVQKYLTQIAETTKPLSRVKLIAELKIKLSGANDLESQTGLNELLGLVSNGTALNFNSKGFLKILTADVGLYSFEDLFKSNVSRAVSRLFIRAYAGDIGRALSLTGVTEPEVQTAFKQLRGIAVDTALILPSNTGFPASRFMEANLFLGTSNGDAYANFGEFHQLIIHIMSGMARADLLRQKIVKTCLPPQSAPVNSETAVWEECLLNVLYTENDSYLDLPQFLNMRSQFPEAENKDYYLSLLKAVGHVPNEKKVVLFVDIDLFPHVVQYVEMVYSRHDVNKDNILEKCEALKAFPIFRDLIKDLTQKFALTEKQLPGVFIYLLKFGRPPKTLAEKLKFFNFINNPEKWDVKATRIDLGKIFNFIGDSTNQKPAKPAPILNETLPTPGETATDEPSNPQVPLVTGCEPQAIAN